MSSKNKFLSVIKQARVTQSPSSRTRYAEYEIMCQMRTVGMGIEKEKVFKWSVWKRFSEIKTLFYAMKASLGNTRQVYNGTLDSTTNWYIYASYSFIYS